jgi:AraC family transcriptional regulator
MVEVIITEKRCFEILGKKTLICNVDNKEIGRYWENCHKDGSIEKIKKYAIDPNLSETKSAILGLSCTEKDPNNSKYWFFIGVETKENPKIESFEHYKVSAYRWAIFQNNKNDINALMECVNYARKHWLVENEKYIHDNGPRIEIYFNDNENKIEYWIPIREK